MGLLSRFRRKKTEEEARCSAVIVSPVTMVPVRCHLHLNLWDGGQDLIRLLLIHHRTHTNLLAILCGDHPGERKMLRTAKQILISELVLSKSASYESVEEELNTALA